MNINNYITSSCTISNNEVSKDGAVVFKHEGASPADFLLSVYQNFQLSYPKFYKMDVLSKLGWLAAEVLLMDSFDKTAYSPAEVGIVLANANSSLDSDLRYMKSVADIASPALFVYTLPNIMIAEISIRNGFKGEGAFFISEKFDAGFIENYVNDLFNNDNLKCCICGWVDVLGDDYKAALFLVEKEQREKAMLFSKSNMDSIFGGDN
ncbi:hypothetical protein ACFQZS_06295 [Mucilaginibacter calamicampi]|uniref:Beta-ketoacyl synthase, N-terminal domain n=1 Tax=Mucilaginibacter calamicampi TaxID=1302352 RepID=A0ABW2YVG0_9SPHI